MQGDSGVGLMCLGDVAGVASLTKECGHGPGLYTDVSQHSEFISNFLSVHFKSDDTKKNEQNRINVPGIFVVVTFHVMFVRFSVNLIKHFF